MGDVLLLDFPDPVVLPKGAEREGRKNGMMNYQIEGIPLTMIDNAFPCRRAERARLEKASKPEVR
jgi:hypothetical protein